MADMFADALLAGVLGAAALPAPRLPPLAHKLDKMHFKVLHLPTPHPSRSLDMAIPYGFLSD